MCVCVCICVCAVLDHERRGSLPPCAAAFTWNFRSIISCRGAAAFKQMLPNKAMLEGGGTV